MTVYLIHLERPMSRGVCKSGKPLTACHYLGYSEKLERRIEHHKNGSGAPILRAANKRGIKWDVVRTWDADGNFEQQLKRRKNAPKLCPICKRQSHE